MKIEDYDAIYDAETQFAGTSIFGFADYATQLFQRGEEADIKRGAEVVHALIGLQVDDPSSRVHGQFPWVAGGKVGDLNVVLFFMPALIRLLEDARQNMPEETVRELDASVQRAIVAAERRWGEERFDLHRDFKGYTNVFLMYIRTILLAGEYYDDDRLLRLVAGQWQRWFNHVSYYGIDEFVSPRYSNIDYDLLREICEKTRDMQIRRETRYVLEHLSVLLHAITHPVLRLPVCGSSRDYRGFVKPGNHEPGCVREVGSSPFTSEAVREDYEKRTFPYQVRGRATTVPFRFQSWQEEHAAVGTMTGGNYFWQQIHCMVAVGKSERERSVLFLPGANTPTSGFVCQREGSALCLFARRPNSFHRTQEPMPDEKIHAFQGDFGIGLTRNWTVAKQETGRIVLSAYDHEVLVQPFEIHDEVVRPLLLPLTRQTSTGQGRFHDTPADFDELVFPKDAVWFGCLISLHRGQAPDALSSIVASKAGEILTLTADGGLSVSVFSHPSGELTEIYDDDWRIQPLLETPIHRLCPGDFTHWAVLAKGEEHPTPKEKH